jgi:exopolysaccharide biosynthesis polyprenyl glycosylphosphotransferase
MIKEHIALFRKLAIITDTLLVSVAFFIAYMLRQHLNDGIQALYPLSSYIVFLPVIILVSISMLFFFGIYDSFRTKTLWEVLVIVAKAFFSAFVIFSGIIYISHQAYISRAFISLIFGCAAVLVYCEKVCVIWFFRAVRMRGYNFKHLLVIGTGRRAQQFVELITQHASWGFKIVGLIDEDASLKGKSLYGEKVLGTFKDIPDIIHNRVIDEVVFVVPRSWLNKIEDIMYLCEAEGLRIHVAVDYFELKFSRGRISELDKFPLLTFSSTPGHIGELICKRIFDVLVSSLILVLCLPLFIVVAVIIKLSSPGPVFFKQNRVGLHGRIFNLFKFRTMIKDAELKLQELMAHNEMSGPVFKMTNDPRITPFGRILRKFSIDELPQFWNVLIGTMSVVGPRPPLPSEVKQYDAWQRRRLSMRPGITCLWQVSGRNKIVDFAKWVKMDLDYIDDWSFWLDMQIFAKTVPVVLFGIGAK